MKLVWKGSLKDLADIPKGKLPENAVKFKEPESLQKLNVYAIMFMLPLLAIILIFTVARMLLWSQPFTITFNIWGLLLAFLMVFPHELLHAVCFPAEAEVEVYYSLKHMVAFVFSTCPTSKARFIFLSAFPGIVLGVLPLAIWLVLPPAYSGVGDVLYSMGAFNLLMCAGDCMNIYNASIQMPKGSWTQLSGFNSYWFYK